MQASFFLDKENFKFLVEELDSVSSALKINLIGEVDDLQELYFGNVYLQKQVSVQYINVLQQHIFDGNADAQRLFWLSEGVGVLVLLDNGLCQGSHTLYCGSNIRNSNL